MNNLEELKNTMSQNGFKYRHSDKIFDRFMHRQLNVYVDHHIKDKVFYVTGEFGNYNSETIGDIFYYVNRARKNA